jgi:hypothetical protein
MFGEARLALPFAALGYAGALVATYKSGGDDGVAAFSGLFAAAIPGIVGFLFNAQLGGVQGPLPRWARATWVFCAGASVGAVVRLVGGLAIDPGVAGLYVFVGALALFAVIARFRLAKYLGMMFARSPWVSAVVMFIASVAMGLSCPLLMIPGFALALLVAARSTRARVDTTIHSFDSRAIWAVTALWLAVVAGVTGHGLPAERLGPFVEASIAGLLAVCLLLLDWSEGSNIRRLLKRPRLRVGENGVTSDPLADWVDFGMGDVEWRFGHKENFVFGMGDPEAARRAARDSSLMSGFATVIAIAVFVVELQRIRLP